MQTLILSILYFLSGIGLDYHEDSHAKQFLTSKEWRLAGFGYDNNGNGKIDREENELGECLEDDSYFFYPDGTVVFSDNELSCGGVPTQSFNWTLNNKNRVMKIGAKRMEIIQLNERTLVLGWSDRARDDQPCRFRIILTH